MAEPIQLLHISKNELEQCLKCSICTAYCPVAAVTPDYPGPKHAGPDGERYRMKSRRYFDEKALKLCLNCKRCEVACPQNVKIGDIIQSARIYYTHHLPSLRDVMLANTDFVGTMANMVAPVVNFSLGLSPVKWGLHHVMGIDHHRTFPSYTSQKFTTWYKKHAAEKQEEFTRFVSYFHGCYANYNYPKLAKDLVKVMNAIGFGVHLLEKEKCCGVALISNGIPKQAKKQGEVNMASMRKAIARGEEILTTSSTCTFTMRDEYKHLLHVENDDVVPHLSLATRFIYRLLDAGDIRLAFRKDYRRRVAYHTACHMEKLGWAVYSIGLLRQIPGLDLVVLDSQCCGIGGTYGFKKENYQVSQAIGESLFEKIRQAGVESVATDCETCKWQIEMSAGLPVENPISILADALDVEETIRLNKR